MSSSITFDDTLWPLLIIRIGGMMSDTQFAEYLAQSSAYVRRGEKYVGITDLSQAGLPSAEQRRQQARWIQEHEAAMREQMLGSAAIVTSTPFRLVLSLIFHVKPLPMPYVLVPDMGSALTWVLARLEEAGHGEEARRIRHQLGLPGSHAG